MLAELIVLGAVVAGLFWLVTVSKNRRIAEERREAVTRGRQVAETEGANPEFLADFLLSLLLFDKFKLTDDELSQLTGNLDASIRGPAAMWMVFYLGWQMKERLREVRGESFAEAVITAMHGRLAGAPPEVEGRIWWDQVEGLFGQFDTARATWAERGHRPPLEMYVAWALLSLDGSSPFKGTMVHPQGLDVQLAACLDAARAKRAGFIAAVVPESGTASEGIESAALGARPAENTDAIIGPRQQQLDRRSGNVLFPAERRLATGLERVQSQEADAQEWALLRQEVVATLQAILDGPDVVDLDVVKRHLDTLLDLGARCACFSGKDPDYWAACCAKGVSTLWNTVSARTSARGRSAFNGWREARMKAYEIDANPIMIALRHAPSEEEVPTICSFSDDEIRNLLGLLSPESDELSRIRRDCDSCLRAAVASGYSWQQAALKRQALGLAD